MLFDEKELRSSFEENSEGLAPEEFLKEKCKALLNLWLNTGNDAFKQVGPYWEVLNPLLAKYAPDEYERYSNLVGGLDYVDKDVLSAYNYNDEILNFMAALAYMGMRQASMQSQNDVHLIELRGNEIPYIPNQRIDPDYYNGRG